jgi:Flp pilus assembly pilin Flp
MKKKLLNLWREEQGQDLTEYGLLLLFIALVSVAVVQGLGSVIENIFSNASSSMS